MSKSNRPTSPGVHQTEIYRGKKMFSHKHQCCVDVLEVKVSSMVGIKVPLTGGGFTTDEVSSTDLSNDKDCR